MNVKIANLNIGSNNDSIYLLPGISGLAKPNIRSSTSNFSGRDGGYLSSQFYAPREIIVRGIIKGHSCEDTDNLRELLMTELKIRTLLDFVFTTQRGTNFFTQVYFVDLNMDIESPIYSKFEITLFAPDSYLYKISGDSGSIDSGGWVEQDIFKIVGGGYQTPYILPVNWEAGSTPTIVFNPTDTNISPQIVLSGKYTNPRITNNTTGEYIQIMITTVVDSVVIIDFFNKSISLNGGSILNTKTLGSTWWSIIPGNNYISLTSDSGADDSDGIIRYRIPYTGVYS